MTSGTKAALSREITAIKGQNDLDEAFAAWLLRMHDGGMTIETPARAAAAHTGAERSYRDVPVLGFAAAANSIDSSQQDVLSTGLTWLSGRQPFVGTSPAPFCTDAVALLGIALGAKSLGDDSIKRRIADWMAKFLAQCYDFRGIQEWQKRLFAVAQRAVDAVPILKVPESASVADVRVALCASGLLPMPDRAQGELDEIEALSLLKHEVDIRISPARAALRLAAFEWVKRSAPVVALSRPTIDEVCRLLHRVPVALRKWTWEEKPRTSGRCAQARKWHVDNEYHVQNLLWLLLAPIFPDLKDEEYTPSVGQLHPRADLCLPSLKLIVEVKFIRPGTAFKEIIEEVAADASLYLTGASIYDNIIAFIWDDSRRPDKRGSANRRSSRGNNMSGPMNIEYSAQIWQKQNQYIAHAMPLDVMSAGPSPEEARRALDEAVHLFLVTAADMGTLEDVLQESGYALTKSPSRLSGTT